MRLRHPICALFTVVAVASLTPTAFAADPGRWVQTGQRAVPINYYQGVTVDPSRNFYFDGVWTGLYRTDANLSETARNDDVIPPDVHAREGYDHIGDITWDETHEGGRVLLPVECYYPQAHQTGSEDTSNICPLSSLESSLTEQSPTAERSGAIGVAQAVSAPEGSPGQPPETTFQWKYYVKLAMPKTMWAEVSPDGSTLWTQDGRSNDLVAFHTADINAANAAPDGPVLQPFKRLAGVVPDTGITGATFFEGRLYVAGQSGETFKVYSLDVENCAAGSTCDRRLEIERDGVVGESEGLATARALNGVLHWLIQPMNDSGPGGSPTEPTYGPTNGQLLTFAPASETQAFDGQVAGADKTTTGYGLDCRPEGTVRFCEGSTANRVRTFDGVPLDVNVTLPADDAAKPYPLVIQLHGWGGSKSGLSATKSWAERGYAVLNYTARGFGNSCGSPASRTEDGCDHGWIRLADSRYEVRDSQYLAGLLADEGLVDPQRIGAMGGSYGGGQSLALATLRDRIRKPDGAYEPWVSPEKHLPMRIAGAAPSIPWSDLVYSLMPNGHTLDYALTDADDDLSPIGVMKATFVSGLFATGATNFYAPPGADQDADLTTWYAAVAAGDPYDESPLAPEITQKIAGLKSPYYLNMDREPAPTLISNGFTDDLFPVDEAIRYANKALTLFPGTDIAQMHFDYGHQRGQNKPDDTARYRQAVADWMDHYVKGDTATQVKTGVEVWTQTCPKSAASGGPYTADNWWDIHPGEVRLRSAAEQTIVSASGDPTVARQFDPVAGPGACATAPAGDQQGAATYRLPKAEGDGYTVVGSPVISAKLAIQGVHSAIAGRLLDVSPDGSQETLVARGLFRPTGDGRQVWQLHPGAWHVAAGHQVKLELLGQDAPYGRPQNFPFRITVSDLELRVPVAERPDCTQVLSPLPPELPYAGATLAPGVPAAPGDACAAAPGDTATAPVDTNDNDNDNDNDNSSIQDQGADRGDSSPSQGVLGQRLASARCISRGARLTSRGIDLLRLGREAPAALRGQKRGPRAVRYCVEGGGRTIVGVFDRSGRLGLIASVKGRKRTIIATRSVRGNPRLLKSYLRLAHL